MPGPRGGLPSPCAPRPVMSEPRPHVDAVRASLVLRAEGVSVSSVKELHEHETKGGALAGGRVPQRCALFLPGTPWDLVAVPDQAAVASARALFQVLEDQDDPSAALRLGVSTARCCALDTAGASPQRAAGRRSWPQLPRSRGRHVFLAWHKVRAQ